MASTLWLRSMSASSEPVRGGDFVLEMLGADGEVLRSVPFAASIGVDDAGPEQTAVGLLVLGFRRRS